MLVNVLVLFVLDILNLGLIFCLWSCISVLMLICYGCWVLFWLIYVWSLLKRYVSEYCDFCFENLIYEKFFINIFLYFKLN